ncbi:RNA recognition motif domain-containing protein [Ditylenchus destructor]|uniref:RNA recognition motif domain-containing protein n=1 Tax=Ditylenchus destructor TaxID=166010 RepID=A0AAD4NHZ5_9BILA|nr:RNA recognition motif domain-containing protein [Ditylenchus destructor]
MDSNTGILRCTICNSSVFNSWEELEIHVASHYSYTPYECSTCLSANQPYKYPTENSLIQHCIYNHRELNGKFYILKYYSEETSEVGAAVLKAMEESMSLLNIAHSLTPSVSGMESVNENETNETLTGKTWENSAPRKRPKREANVTVTNLSYENGEPSSMRKSIGQVMQPIAQNVDATNMDIIDENLTRADQSQQINGRQILSPEMAYSEHAAVLTDTMTEQNEHYATSHNRPAFSNPSTTMSAKKRHESLRRTSQVSQASTSNSVTLSEDASLDPRMKGRNAPDELDTESDSNNASGKAYQTVFAMLENYPKSSGTMQTSMNSIKHSVQPHQEKSLPQKELPKSIPWKLIPLDLSIDASPNIATPSVSTIQKHPKIKFEIAMKSKGSSLDNVPPRQISPSTSCRSNEKAQDKQTLALKQSGESGSRKKLPPVKDEKFRKLVVDSLSPNTTDASLRIFYSQFGEVCKCYVKKREESNQFCGFVTFSTVQEVDTAMVERPHIIDGSRVEPNRMRDKDEPPSTRMYVSKFRSTHTIDEFKNYFSTFGNVVDACIVRNRSAVLITFDDYDAVDKCVLQNPHAIGNHDCTARRLTSAERKEFKKYLDFAYGRCKE